ncbi:HdeD family acid-resistance protein [Mucilaginibacter sp. X5P1]|uniref:HdeD family acid-resistance protein n=1 Tax=Mucilaginibacter sp. X5P1 TaxID=2723088 RepID=UPI0016115F5B|nr:DUF308 domain-containing protein [Mucilaginibacter sp. X5P1]MBB6136693.1 uncharacterized membrane protein HdeD (DUF308 family) [Mucilaginibacter sp. X5P1]
MELSVDGGFRQWWLLLIRGLLFILAGIYMIASPATSFVALGFIFGLMILLAGISELLHVSNSHSPGSRNWHLGLGILEVVLGIVFISHIATSVAVLRILVGLWFIFRGIALFNYSRIIGASWVTKLGGIVTVIFGLLILFDVVFGSMTIILFVAIGFIITGFFNVWLGYSLKPRT